MDQDYALNHIGSPDSLRENLIFLWLYDAEQAHKVYLVLNANLRGEKVLFEFEKGNSIFFKEIFTPLENSLRHYDGSAKSRKAIESFNDADGFMRKNQSILAPNLESWIQYSSTMALK